MKIKRHYQLKDFLKNPKDICHVNRVTIHSTEQTPRQDHFYHDHNFAEIFWIEEGEGWHFINDEKIYLKTGVMVMMRPKDSHTFYAKNSKKNLTLTNISFPEKIMNEYKKNYFKNSTVYFWTSDKLPFIVQLDNYSLQKISLQASILFEPGIKSRLKLDTFMLSVFDTLEKTTTDNSLNPTLPFWFQKALKMYITPEHFSGGIYSFIKLAHRSREHVNDTAQKYLKKTLTEVVNDAKMKYALIQLTNTDASIKSIYNACGFENKSHFYKIFKKQFNTSPSAYRKFFSRIN